MILAERVAFVTGAASGIGAAGARAMAREGGHVVVSDINGDGAEAVAAALRDEGLSAEGLQLDVTDDEALRAAIAGTAERHGRLDILHSHAGIQIEGKLEQVSADDMDASWRLNVRAHFVAAQAALAPMRAQGRGSVIITSSNSGVQYDREMIAYCTTKHAVLAMTRQMAADYARENIRFNVLCPGFINTPFNRGFKVQMGGRERLEEYIRTAIPMGRFGTVDEIADAIVYLASDRSSFMTGHALVVDGGESPRQARGAEEAVEVSGRLASQGGQPGGLSQTCCSCLALLTWPVQSSAGQGKPDSDQRSKTGTAAGLQDGERTPPSSGSRSIWIVSGGCETVGTQQAPQR